MAAGEFCLFPGELGHNEGATQKALLVIASVVRRFLQLHRRPICIVYSLYSLCLPLMKHGEV